MAGTEVGSLYYDLTIDDKKLKGQLDHAENKLQKFGHKLADVGRVAAVAFAAVGAAATAVAVTSVKAYSESQDAIAQTNAVLKSTGGVAGVSASQVEQLATSMQKLTKFSDEEIRSAQNMLLTFTNIGKDVFPEATKTVLDMSQALGQDLKSSSIQLGKALNNPIDGITALTRVGVKFTDSQKEQITALVNAGKTMEAQKIILKELQTEFGGSAVAAGQTFAGKMAILKNNINDVQEAIGFVIVDAIQPLVANIANFVNAVDWEVVIDRSIMAIKRLWQDYLQPFGQAVFDVATKVGEYLLPKFTALWHTIQDELIPTLSRLWHEVIAPLAPIFGVVLVGAIGLTVDIINALMTVLIPAINWMLDNKGVVIALATAFGILALAMNFNAIVASFNAALNGAIVTMNVLRLVTIPSALTSLSQFAAGFGPVGIAATIAAGVIIDAGNRAKAAWDNTRRAIESATSSNAAVIGRLQALAKNGSPEERERARITLKKLAEAGSFAGGVTNFSGGLAYVHQGELLVNLPKGTDVITKGQTQQMMGGSSTTVNIGTITDREDADYILRRLNRNSFLASQGLSPVAGEQIA